MTSMCDDMCSTLQEPGFTSLIVRESEAGQRVL